MARQHATPILVSANRSSAESLVSISVAAGGHGFSEADIQTLVQTHPTCLPIAEIDPLFANPVPICMELNTPAGPIDNFMVTASGLPILVECKLWKNPESRREVVGQILDYAKELSRWSSSDLQREVSRRLKQSGNIVLEMVRAAGHDVDEVAFNDALTLNLRRGRFLLLIVGDGIREGVEAIAEYLQAHAGLHFTLGLVEIPIFALPDGSNLLAPRVLAKTLSISRVVVEVPQGYQVVDTEAEAAQLPEDTGPLSRIGFWSDFVAGLSMDDPEQPKPKPGNQGYVTVTLPVPGGTAWITVWRNVTTWKVGLYLSYTRGSIGERAVLRTVEDWPEIRNELAGTSVLATDKLERQLIQDELQTADWISETERQKALVWLRQRTNEFVNVLRPRIRTAVAELNSE